MASHFFISDLHLDESRPDASQAFLQFLESLPPDALSLYILGDLFESWIGDDLPGSLGATVMKSLAALQKRQISCFFQAGNRDFLIGSEFAAGSNSEILPDYFCTEVDGKKILLMHGDLLCTDDLAYQEIRKMLRSSQWQQDFLDKPEAERLEFARQARDRSQQHQSRSTDEIMDANADAVAQTCRHYNVDTLIHGHTHKPGLHYLNISNQHVLRIVLGDWYHQGSVLTLREGQFTLTSMPLGDAGHYAEAS